LYSQSQQVSDVAAGPKSESMSSPRRRSEDTRCQYFVLSPRPSLESPRRQDENANQNVPRAVVKVVKGRLPKAKAQGVKTPVRPATPKSRRQEEPVAKTPAPLTARGPCTPYTPKMEHRAPLTARTPATRTPATGRSPSSRSEKRLEDDDLSASVCSANFSVFSEASVVSRLTQLSRKSFSKRILSSKELEDLEVMQKRQELNAMMRRNQMNCRKALHATDLNSAGRKQSTSKLTEPKEFHFSCPPTPRAGSPVRELEGPIQAPAFPRLLRSTSSQSLETKPRSLTLTVPQGPQLRVVRRLSLRPNSCPPEDREVKTPRTHRVEVRKAAAEEERRAVRTPVITSRQVARVVDKEKVVFKRSTSDECLGNPFGGQLSRSTKTIRGGPTGASSPRTRATLGAFGSKTPRWT